MNDQFPARTAAALPASVGRYRVLGRLGKGAMGVVYRARDDQLARDVAVKLLMTDVEDEPEARTRFFREAQITSGLVHRNVVSILDLGEDDGRLFIVMELLKGETLTEFLKRPDTATLEQQIDLMIQTCEGLAVAHTKGVVHRDIKPGNLFVLSDGSLKILDFGVARLASSTMTASGLIIGTPDFMSPEQARGLEVDGRSDIFSAAAVFYLMLTGRRPFEAPSLPAVLQKVIREEPLPIREHEAPAVLARIIARALRKDASERYQRFADLVVDLVRFKRQFDNETRRLAGDAMNRFDDVRRRAADVKELRAALLMRPAADTAEPEALEARYPFFCAGADGERPLGVPTVRRRVTSILGDLEVAQGAVTREAQRLKAGLQEIELAERAITASDPRVALNHLERAAPSLSAPSERLVADKAKAEHLLGERKTHERRVGLSPGGEVQSPQRRARLVGPSGVVVTHVKESQRVEAEARARRVNEIKAPAASGRRPGPGANTGEWSSGHHELIFDPDDTVILAARSSPATGFMAGMAERVRAWRRKRAFSRSGH